MTFPVLLPRPPRRVQPRYRTSPRDAQIIKRGLIDIPEPFWAWFTGFWEGEGSSQENHGSLRLRVVQKDRSALDYIMQTLGCGKVYTSRFRNIHVFVVNGEPARYILSRMRPYIRSNHRIRQIEQLSSKNAYFIRRWACAELKAAS